ncbi:MAG: CBS domain-containing protein [Euryarchaeota archaeon]|nr:CBS domain-containing protein [Euryarchaeota archaeon]
MRLEKYMQSPVIAAESSSNLEHVRNLMIKNNISRVVVLEGGKPVGIVTRKDMARRLGEGRAPWRRRPIDKVACSRVMTRGLVTLPPEAEVREAARIMVEKGISSIPVVEDGSLVGIVTTTDLLRAYVENMEGRFKTSEIMTKDVITANRNHTIAHLVELMVENGISRVVITEGAKPVGIVTATDLSLLELEDPVMGIKARRVLFVRKPEQASRPRYRYVKTLPFVTAGDVMSSELVTANENEDSAAAAKRMLDHGISSLPVVNDASELCGIVTKRDILRAMVER